MSSNSSIISYRSTLLIILIVPTVAVAITLLLLDGWTYHALYLSDSRLAYIRLDPVTTWTQLTLLLGTALFVANRQTYRGLTKSLRLIRFGAIIITVIIAVIGLEHIVHTTKFTLDHGQSLSTEYLNVLIRYSLTYTFQILLVLIVLIILSINSHREINRRKHAT